MNVVVRETDDYKGVLKVAQSSKRYFEKGFDQLKKDIKNHLLFGAYLDNKVIGFITYEEKTKDVIEISWLSVLPTYRGRSVGSKLVLESLRQLKNGFKICEVKTLAETHERSWLR